MENEYRDGMFRSLLGQCGFEFLGWYPFLFTAPPFNRISLACGRGTGCLALGCAELVYQLFMILTQQTQLPCVSGHCVITLYIAIFSIFNLFHD